MEVTRIHDETDPDSISRAPGVRDPDIDVKDEQRCRGKWRETREKITQQSLCVDARVNLR